MVLSDRDIDLHVERVQRDGYSVIEDAIEPALIDEIERDLARIEREEKVVPAENIFEGLKTVRIYNLLARGRVYERIPVHGSVLPIVERVLDRGCLVSSLSSIAIGPGEDAQILHADDQLIPLPKPHVPIICNTMWAITDFTAENGATRVAPGSQKRDRSRSGWMRQQENQQLGVPLDVARHFSGRLRRLCGFGLYRGLIGHIDKCSPADLLDGCGPRPVVGVVGGAGVEELEGD